MLKQVFSVLALSVLCIVSSAQNVFDPADPLVTYSSAATPGSATNPNVPANGVMSKWVRTSRMSWSTTNFKSYIWNGMAFRLRFPNNYNVANASKYPVLVFYHGGGETGSVYDNEYQLLWGAQVFEQRIAAGEWNGFLIFPQETQVGWDDNYFSRVNSVLDTLQKYNNADPDRVIAMGLSSGGYGAAAYASIHPKRVAASLPSSPAFVRTLDGNIPDYVHIPFYIANGGQDNNPDPSSTSAFISEMLAAGGNTYQTYFVNDGHNTWTDMWNMKNAAGGYIISSYWNAAHKAQPLVYYNHTQFCTTETISARMGITAGFAAYEWQKDGVTIPGANGNEYTATATGQYRVRFQRDLGGAWSAWSPTPVTISTKSCATDTLFAEHFNADNGFVAETPYKPFNFGCQGGIVTSGTELFTQDASGVQGNRFLVNYTSATSGCTYNAGDRVWNTNSPFTVQPNTNYEFSFYFGNQNATSPAQIAPTVNGTALTTGYVQTTGTGNASWKKFTYTWNSGSFTFADLGLINRNTATSGNDFAIDEISFKLAPAVPVPSCTPNTSPANAATLTTSTTASLAWTAAANASSYDVYLWASAGTVPTTPVANVTTAAYSATGLTANTKYSWYVVPKNSAGVAATGCSNNQTSFTTAAALATPACVTNISPANNAGLTTSSSAALSWNAAATATSYDVYLWTGATAPTTPTATVATTSYSATGLAASATYKWYVAPRNAAGAASGCSVNATSFTTAAATGTGTGLKGDYYNNTTVSGGIAYSRTDATVNFNWGTSAPVFLFVRSDNFSVRWTGFVQPLYSQTYTFYTTSDDGVRLWVNGVQLVNNWTDHGVTENSGSITLTAGVKYSIVMEYYEKTGNATATLSWSSASTAKAIIPQRQLYLPSQGGRVMSPDLQPAATTTAVENRLPGIQLANGVYPNPVVRGQNAVLQVNSARSGNASVQVMNSTGNIVRTMQLSLLAGSNTRTLQTGDLAPGAYIVRVTGEGQAATTTKLLVR